MYVSNLFLLLVFVFGDVKGWYRQFDQNGFRYHVSSSSSSSSNSYPVQYKYSTNSTVVRYRPGRHVCTSTPSIRTVTSSCHRGRVCKSARLENDLSYICCPGWTYLRAINHGCFQPICSTECSNGGSCISPETCSCPAGFTGKFCEIDVDECVEEKPCDQTCTNTEGSFYCSCKDGFELLDDGRSCRSEANTASEADDLDNDVEILTRKLFTLEEKLTLECNAARQSDEKMNSVYEKVTTLISRLQKQEQRIEELQLKVERLHKSEPIIKKVVPLCAQVSSLKRQVNQCYCSSSSRISSQYRSHYGSVGYQ